MTDISSNNTLDQLLSTSEAMHNCAQKGEWEVVAELDITRRNLLDDLQKESVDELTSFSPVIKEILSINKQVLSLIHI